MYEALFNGAVELVYLSALYGTEESVATAVQNLVAVAQTPEEES